MIFIRKVYGEMKDESLMEAASGGDTSAFTELYDRYSRSLLTYFNRMLRNDREKAKDMVQELFMKVITRPGLFDVERSFKTWIFSIAHNMCKNEYKKEEIRNMYREETAPSLSSFTDGSIPLKQIDRKLFTIALNRELELLEPFHRETFTLRYIQEFSIKEISILHNCSEGTVKSRLFYALKKLTPKLSSFRLEKKTQAK